MLIREEMFVRPLKLRLASSTHHEEIIDWRQTVLTSERPAMDLIPELTWTSWRRRLRALRREIADADCRMRIWFPLFQVEFPSFWEGLGEGRSYRGRKKKDFPFSISDFSFQNLCPSSANGQGRTQLQ